jgi:hypothetical protein
VVLCEATEGADAAALLRQRLRAGETAGVVAGELATLEGAVEAARHELATAETDARQARAAAVWKSLADPLLDGAAADLRRFLDRVNEATNLGVLLHALRCYPGPDERLKALSVVVAAAGLRHPRSAASLMLARLPDGGDE